MGAFQARAISLNLNLVPANKSDLKVAYYYAETTLVWLVITLLHAPPTLYSLSAVGAL
jgi:hypothetical protein